MANVGDDIKNNVNGLLNIADKLNEMTSSNSNSIFGKSKCQKIPSLLILDCWLGSFSDL